ncbi:bifunctional DNA primase/polymerase [Komagataeibacter oboediens]|uniref:bifunctional DNA primase/polymerase n=1 Tax=Komagataeibacter oboediens TaxID=65958 RepID=UPI001C2D7E0C|nr:bifunctional DNA primase/polymerase [Komagataeibacter oboediens]MBV1825803.1 bifunctional DNA primase/polymerase [Komagataeibacter oboediens]
MHTIPPDLLRVARMGWHVLPVRAGSRAACFRGAVDHATTCPDTLARWAARWPGCGWRVVCGPSGLFALDVDRPGTHAADGVAALSTLVRRHGPLPPRPMTRTGGSGGAVLFFRHDGEPLRGQAGYPAPGLDSHRGRQAVTIPPGTHPATGGAYTWRVPPWEVPPPPIPRWLARLLAPAPDPAVTPAPRMVADRAPGVLMRALHAVCDAPPGMANTTLNARAYTLGRWCGAGMMDLAQARDTLLHAAQRRHIPMPEARATIRSGLNAGLRNPRPTGRALP